MLKPVEYKQGKTVFYIHRFPPFMAMRVLGELNKIIAPVLGGAAKGLEGADMEGGNGLGAIAPVLGDALKNLMMIDGDVMEHVLRLVLDENYISVSTNGSKNNLAYLTEEKVNEVFEGKPIDMIMLAVEVVKVNYLDFTMLSSIPTGFLKTLGTMKSAFRESLQTNLEASSLSTE